MESNNMSCYHRSYLARKTGYTRLMEFIRLNISNVVLSFSLSSIIHNYTNVLVHYQSINIF